jgi:hypothetical protein
MKRVLAYLRRLLRDLLFQRVFVALFTLPFALVGTLLAVNWRPSGWEWIFWLLFAAMGVYGAIMFFTAIFASDSSFKRVSKYLDDGMEPAAVLLIAIVMILAVPITVILRKLLRRPNAL